MASSLKNLSEYTKLEIPSAKQLRLGIVVAEWNPEITEALYRGALQSLLENGARPGNIIRKNVPGSFELPLGGQFLAEYQYVDAVICLGCVIQGETRHFEFICNSVSQGLIQLSLKYNKPFIFGVLTPNTLKQAKERSGGKHGNKGVEAAITAIKMISLQKNLRGTKK
jgi:6,7-dimethyl-8-ribityllumazine synthase